MVMTPYAQFRADVAAVAAYFKLDFEDCWRLADRTKGAMACYRAVANSLNNGRV
jgi:hypothetical protein